MSKGEQHSGESSDTSQHLTQPVTPINHPEQISLIRLGPRSSALILLLVYALGLGSGYLFWGRTPITPINARNKTSPSSPAGDAISSKGSYRPTGQDSPANQISLPKDYTLPVSLGDIGPQLLAAGAIDYDRFVQVYEQAGRPLTEEQLSILTKGNDALITIDRENAYFLLNFFWALGLTNQNLLLEEGPMMEYSEGEIGRFASTGGWTIGAKPATELYSSTPLITLSPEQQARLEEAASAVYRPCCNNPTAFPDCNHGMAMLGLLELMASQDASEDEMFEAAKYANAFWFPQQTLEMAVFFKAAKNQDFAEVDAREMVGRSFSSGSGFQALHQWLADNGLLEQAPNGGSSCGV